MDKGDNWMASGEPVPTTLSAWLNVRDSAKAFEFYKAAFGAKEIFTLDGGDKGVLARFSIGTSEFWMSDESPEHKNFSPETIGGCSVRLILIVPDPDAAFAQAIAAGATLECPMTDDHGWRVGRVIDPFGHLWEIGRKVD
jgi:PhnB protein